MVKGRVNLHMLPGLYQGRVNKIRESKVRWAYLVDMSLEARVTEENVYQLGEPGLQFEIPFNDGRAQWEFGTACGIDRPRTKGGNFRHKYMIGRRPLLLVRFLNDDGSDLDGGDVEIPLFLRCRELKFDRWSR